MQVLGIGEVVLDKVSLLQEYLKEGTKVKPIKVEYSIGGPVPTALILLSRLGVRCSFIGTIGEDEYGRRIKYELKKENVIVMPKNTKRTKVHTVIVNSKDGSRTIVKDAVKSEQIKKISKDVIKAADLIIVDRHEPYAFNEVIKKKRLRTKVIIDPSTEMSARTMKMMQYADYPIIPIETLSKIRRYNSVTLNLKNLYKKILKTIIITAGDKGSLIYDGKTIKLIPAADVAVIDTLGAGDVYRGAFSYGVLKEWKLNHIVKFANTVAALQCTKLGNGMAIPTKDEIDKFKKVAYFKRLSLKDIKFN